MRVVCVGAGPGGLYAALQLKRRRPDWDVSVVEQNGPDETSGFGVVFSEPTLARLSSGDPVTYAALLRIAQQWDPIELRLRGDVIRCSGQGFVGVGRHALLSMLRVAASDAGVTLRFHATVDPAALPEADVVVVADGSRSAIRRHLASSFEPTVETGRSKFIWFGTTKPFESLTFLFEKSEHGAFAVHAYPFSKEQSTFIVETDDEALRSADLDVPDREESERRSLAYCEKVFAAHLDGHRLLANQSRWAAFRTVRCGSWRAGRVVLLGDAAHTAHFSMGSGTKMALEDGLALADALCGSPDDIDAALATYEATRRPEVRKVQQASRPSLFWWESFRHVMGRDIEAFAFHFLTRNLRVTRESLVRRDPAFAQRIAAWQERTLGSDGGRGARGLSLVVRGLTLRNRMIGDAHSADAALRILSPDELKNASSARTEQRTGVLLRAKDLGAELDEITELARDARCDWLELSVPANERGLRSAARARELWPRPLSLRLEPEGRPADEVVQLAIRAANLGVDVISLSWVGKEQPDIVACAEGIRFASPVLIAVDVGQSADPDTLILSGRADLCVIRPAPPAPSA
ncbi:MAG TPA: FAD-dependent monooxygenase [Labilithrix sp.]|nr:FAD-dependent monooxygenase [Labilithrix sp.]